jgi:hypothetical protein
MDFRFQNFRFQAMQDAFALASLAQSGEGG